MKPEKKLNRNFEMFHTDPAADPGAVRRQSKSFSINDFGGIAGDFYPSK